MIRIRFVVIFILLFFSFLLARIYYLSIKSNIYYEEMARQNAIKTQYIAPIRGDIKDKNGNLLAVNDLGFSILIKPYLYIKKKNRKILEAEINEISFLFKELNSTKLLKKYQKSDSYYNQDFIEIVDFINYEEMIPYFSYISLKENISIQPVVKRKYPYGNLASHVIGYVGKANLQDMNANDIAKLTKYTGKSGIERYYNEILQGERGIRTYKVNALNQEIEELSYVKSKSNDIELSLDIKLQEFISKLFDGNSGAVIVMDIKDGSILSAGSFPEYDLNQFVNGISIKEWKELSNNLDHPFANKIANGLYPPGSVVKMGVALSFLNSNLINNWSEFHCSGLVELGNRKFRCWNRSGHGNVNLKHAIKQSCDVYFYEGGLKVGIDQISNTLEKLGFGSKTGIDLPNEFVGTVPSKEWKMQRYKKPWYQGETLNTSIGQGDFLVTPIQIAKYIGEIAVAKEIKPHFLKSIENNNTLNFNSKDIFTQKEKEHLFYIREAMYAVANEEGGTAYRYLNNLPIKVAAKTGTAQVIGFSQSDKNRVNEDELKYYTRSHTWLATYAPYKNPKYVVVVLLEHGGRNTTSGIITSEIYKKMYQMGYFK